MNMNINQTAFLELLKEQNFYQNFSKGKDKRHFFVIGKKGRCYENKYTLYEIGLDKIDSKIQITYQSVLISYSRLSDAIKVLSEYENFIKKQNEQEKIVEEQNRRKKIYYIIQGIQFSTPYEVLSILKNNKKFDFEKAKEFFQLHLDGIEGKLTKWTEEEFKKMFDETPAMSKGMAKMIYSQSSNHYKMVNIHFDQKTINKLNKGNPFLTKNIMIEAGIV